MIHLTSFQGSTQVAINPMQVTYIREAAANQGCIIFFNGDKPLHVANNFNEVVGSITAAKHQ